MCKAGGPRCENSSGQKAQVALSRKVKRLASKNNQSVFDWKYTNPVAYDKMTYEQFSKVDAHEEEVIYGVYDDNDVYENPGHHNFADENSYDEDDFYDADADAEDLWAEETDEAHSHESNSYQSRDYDFYQRLFDSIQHNNESAEETRDELEPTLPSNRHLIEENAIIHSPTPNPVFTYGTLRSGEGNNRVVKDKVRKAKNNMTLPGASMYTNRAFPYLIENEDENVTGDLVYLDYDKFTDAIDSLDGLEGTHSGIFNDRNHYNRYLWLVKTKEPTESSPAEYVQAWVYMPPREDYETIKNRCEPVYANDWKQRFNG